MGSYTVYILIQNFESNLEKLFFDEFTITRIDESNWEELKNFFAPVQVYRDQQYFIERQYDSLPALPKGTINVSGLGSIPYDSEDLMLLLRLFKAGDIVFIAQAVKDPRGQILRQYPYPTLFCNYHSLFHYDISEEEIPKFNEFFMQATKWPGWKSDWFEIARRYFLWGGSKEFFPGRDNERILDYMIALEASLVYEGDFVSRRLCKRAAAILGGTEKKREEFTRKMKSFYDLRSTLIHGNRLSKKKIKFLEEKMPSLENDIRQLLKGVLKNCPSNDKIRQNYLSKLYDVSDKEKAQKVISDFKGIKDVKMRNKVLSTISELGIRKGS